MTTLTLEIAGMTCNHCTASVREALLRLPGVASAEVSLERKLATVVCDEATVDRGELREAIEAIGFEVV